VDGIGVSVMGPTGALSTLCTTDATSAAIEELQFTLGVGPCLDAHALGVPVLLDDLAGLESGLTERWPGFAQAVASTGAGALFALPLRMGAIGLGAMDLYRKAAGPLSAPELAAALVAVDAVGLVVLGLHVPESRSMAGSGRAFRMEVHQAAGMVMEQMGLTIDSALLVLRSTAYIRAVPVDEVAGDVVAGRLRFPAEEK